MMSKEEIGKPVGFADLEEIHLMQSGRMRYGMMTIRKDGEHGLYSQEYVFSLLQRISQLQSEVRGSHQGAADLDTIALGTAHKIFRDIKGRSGLIGGDVQLLAKIQCHVEEACRIYQASQGKS
ncbi:hypothetical protein G646_gp183 [Serratia phage phiMAM1]|uniref:Uncharacterized protein n=1 Tax=Serratia phage phiMAM1 TaxID=1262513 RepID=K7YJ05_9CAUD|nr:hypothetical protein G646_gp183 [Serratia phage phiMAM1]AFX93651.1 hypothetical protein MAM_183 [Serratia phage phiMAM1]